MNALTEMDRKQDIAYAIGFAALTILSVFTAVCVIFG